jgi:hypothetical protein
MLLYSEVLLLRGSLDCGENVASTSLVCVSVTVIQMITEYRILCRYVVLQWHNVMTKNRYHQWIPFLLSRGWIRDQFSDCLAFVSLNFPSWIESRIITYTKMSKKNMMRNYRPVIDLIMEYFCFSHVKRLAALWLWPLPKYPESNIKVRLFPLMKGCL